MRFEETADLSICELHKYIVYFLIYKNDVVYVGQSTRGLVRPFSHVDKIFDSVEVLFINGDKKLLNQREAFYIKKYNPKYNRTFNSEFYSQEAANELAEIDRIENFNKMYKTRKEINLILKNANFKPLSIRKFKKLLKYYKSDKNKILLTPETYKSLLNQLLGKRFNEYKLIQENLKSFYE